MYTAFVQMPLALYDEQTAVVETEIELADAYMPIEGQWMFHDLFHGIMPLGPVVYDGTRNVIVLTTKGTVYDFTVTLEEWLQSRPEWYVAEKPFIAVGQPKKDIEEDDS